ncbi:hypothetical protein C5167_003974 [Papaver somniferum]|nr:hypothetical protein C5167_003974 [Papaver somniferum]
MAIHGANREGKLTATVVCWILGNGCLFPWYSMVTSFDYFGDIFPLDIATSGEGGIGTYIGVCLISSAYGVANALVEGGLVGDLSLMCPEFMQSFLVGLSFAGALTSALRLITKVAFENSKNGLRKGAMMFFAISVLFELLCLLLYAYIFPKLPIVKYYRAKAASEGSKTVSADLVAGGIQTLPSNQAAEEDLKYMDRLSNKELFVQNMDFAITVLLIYVLSFSIFPGFLSEDTGKHGLGTWYGIVLIATFNIWDLIGTYIPLIECLKLRSRKGLLITSLSRFLLIPCFYFTVKLGDQGWMIMLTSILGLTSGYLTVRVLTVAPKGYKGPEQNALGNFLVLFLAMGIFVGVTLDWLWLIGQKKKKCSKKVKFADHMEKIISPNATVEDKRVVSDDGVERMFIHPARYRAYTCKITTYSSPKVLKWVPNLLSPAEQEKFMSTAIGFLLHLPMQTWSSSLFHFLLASQISTGDEGDKGNREEMCVMVCGKEFSFGKKEFALISGLSFRKSNHNFSRPDTKVAARKLLLIGKYENSYAEGKSQE